MKIKAVLATQIPNSRSQPTIQITLKTEEGTFNASAPYGAAVSKREVKAYVPNLRGAINHFNKKTAAKLVGFKVNSFRDFAELEKLASARKLGGNPVIALEYAILKALAKERKKEIYQLINPRAHKVPMPLGNAIGGGAHGGGSDIQEILFSPKCKTFKIASKINNYVHKLARKELAKQDKTFRAMRTDEGAWISSLPATKLLRIANNINQHASNKFGREIILGIDLAGSQLYSRGKYRWKNLSGKKKRHVLSPRLHLGLMALTEAEFKLGYIEDPFNETDFKSFSELAKYINGLVCADDLTCTNPALLKRAIKSHSCDAVIIKPNQIGSLVKTVEFAKLAKKAGLRTVVSHRSGTTMDTTLAHIALALHADFFKCGIVGKERVVKIKELIRLEKGLKK